MGRERTRAQRARVSAEFSCQERPQVEGSRASDAAPGERGGPEEEGPEVRPRMLSGHRKGELGGWSSNPTPNSWGHVL